jgi:signal peptidase II
MEIESRTTKIACLQRDSAAHNPFCSPFALLLFFGTAALGLFLDLWTKILAVQHLAEQPPLKVIPGWLHFTFTQNRGAVFGIGQGRQWLFVTVSIGAIFFLTYLFWQSGRQRIYQLILGMLLAGVLGNMYDRIHFGYVRDMILALPGWKWPRTSTEVFPWVFNVADTMLCVGVFLMIVYSFLQPKKMANEP